MSNPPKPKGLEEMKPQVYWNNSTQMHSSQTPYTMTAFILQKDHEEIIKALQDEVNELREQIKREVVPDIKDKEIAALEQQLAEAEKVISYYADKEKWKETTKWAGSRGGWGDDDNLYPVTSKSIDSDKGKCAREFLKGRK